MKTQIPLEGYPTAMRIGLDFVDADGVRRTSCQLVDAAGYAIASADFADGRRMITCQLVNSHGTAIATANFADGKLIGSGVRPEVDFALFLGFCSSLIRKA